MPSCTRRVAACASMRGPVSESIQPRSTAGTANSVPRMVHARTQLAPVEGGEHGGIRHPGTDADGPAGGGEVLRLHGQHALEHRPAACGARRCRAPSSRSLSSSRCWESAAIVPQYRATDRQRNRRRVLQRLDWVAAPLARLPHFLRPKGSPVLAVHDLEIRVGARVLMQDVNFRVSDGDKIGLVGRNGAGKTTLTKTLAGETLPTGGTHRPHAARSATCRRTRAPATPRSWPARASSNARGLGSSCRACTRRPSRWPARTPRSARPA